MELNREREYSQNFSVLDFRKIGGFNERLGSWSPIINNSRYFKSLLFEFTNILEKRFNEELNCGLNDFLSRIKNKHFGQPTTVTYKDTLVDIDYLLSAEEILFLHKQLNEAQNILEVGPGFGRLPHSILQTFDNVKKYFIVDLDFMIELQKEYLVKVLTREELSKIEFLTPKEISKISNIELTINIDSFQEIEPNIVNDYLDFISQNSKFFYSKNAVCKYSPNSLDIIEYNEEQYLAALEMGLCREVIDIFDVDALKIAKEKYINAYCPKNMKMIKSQDCFGQYNYYYSVLYSS